MKHYALLLFLVVSGSVSLFADNLAAVPVGGAAGVDPRPYMIGWRFSVTSALPVTGLTYLDATGQGLGEAHTVGIFNDATGALLVSATVPAGTAAALFNGYRVVPVSYTLAPGTYVIGGQKPTNVDAAVVGATSVSTVPGLTYLQERELKTDAFVMPSDTLSNNEEGSFGPSFTVASSTVTPLITGITNAANYHPGVAPSTYISIFGTGLSKTTRGWTAGDFVGGTQLPLSLDGVSVTVSGSPAYVEYISATQINIIAPATIASVSGVPNSSVVPTDVPIVITTPGQASVTVWAAVQSVSPAPFTWSPPTADAGKYVAAQHANFSGLGKIGLFPSLGASFTTPAKPGETILLYGTGFGATTPAITPGIMTDKIYNLSPLPIVTIGGIPATVTFAGLVPPLSDVYQINVVVPSSLTAGDWPVIFNIQNTASPSSLLTVVP